jgi:hypothetical protein
MQSKSQIRSIGIDLGKTTFHLVALGNRCQVVVRKKFSRQQLYTDGLSEARNEGGEYGVDRIMTLVRQQAARQPAELIAACLDDLQVFADGGRRLDDLTLLAIRRRG